jgi:ketosteroid isomerase-like protein
MPIRFRRRLAPNVMLAASLTLLVLAGACTQQTPDTRAAVDAIREQDAQWSKTAGTGDLDGTVSYYSDDASVLPPNAPLATDKAGIRALWTALVAPAVSTSWTATKVDVASSGDLGYAMGTYDIKPKDPKSTAAADHGKFVEIWKKQADGKWKCAVDIFNSDLSLPTPVAPPPTKKK